MPWRSLCEASESLERQQASCPRHVKHKPAKMLPVTFGSHKTCLVAGTLAARLGPKPAYRNADCRGGGYAKLPKASNSSKIRAQGMQNTSQKKGSQKRCVRNPSTWCRNCWQRIRKGQTPLQAELGQAKNDAFATLPHGAETAASKP